MHVTKDEVLDIWEEIDIFNEVLRRENKRAAQEIIDLRFAVNLLLEANKTLQNQQMTRRKL